MLKKVDQKSFRRLRLYDKRNIIFICNWKTRHFILIIVLYSLLYDVWEIVIAEIKNISSTFNFRAAFIKTENSHSVSGVDVVCLCVGVKITSL